MAASGVRKYLKVPIKPKSSSLTTTSVLRFFLLSRVFMVVKLAPTINICLRLSARWELPHGLLTVVIRVTGPNGITGKDRCICREWEKGLFTEICVAC